MKIREINIDKKFNCEHMLGTFLDESHADILIENEAVNIYGPKGVGQTENDESNMICGLRPGVFSPEEIQQAYEGLQPGATESTNRSQSAGKDDSAIQHRRREIASTDCLAIINWMMECSQSVQQVTKQDILDQWNYYKGLIANGKKIAGVKNAENRGVTWQRKKMDDDGFFGTGVELLNKFIDDVDGLSNSQISEKAVEFEDFYISGTETAYPVLSGIGGYYGRYPRIPYCRTTLYTGGDVNRWEKCLPYINKVDQYFKELLPTRHAIQKKVADGIDPELRIGNTAFTTITINNNFRTACHRDAGDLKEGFGNLSCTGRGEWDGGYTIMPEYRVGVKLNPGDVLIMDVHQIHGNTAIREKKSGREAKFIGNKKNEDFAVDFERVSLVCYLRENMSECGSKVYEDLRRQFVQDRINDKEHPGHSKYVHRSQTWNGVSPGMWESDDWVDYLRKNGFDAEADELRPTINTIDSLFA